MVVPLPTLCWPILLHFVLPTLTVTLTNTVAIVNTLRRHVLLIREGIHQYPTARSNCVECHMQE
jgi:hypothetical protein